MDIEYTTKLKNQKDIYSLYQCLGWNNFLKLNEEQISKAMEQSFHVLYAYDKEKLIGTGRVVSDGVINAYICGLGIVRQYRNKGIGSEIINRMMKFCRNHNLHIQLFCEKELIPYYQKLGFDTFAMGMAFTETQD